MDSIQEVRLKNANDILRIECEGKAKIFAERMSRSASYISTYISGKELKPISDKVAHTIEQAFNLSSGRLDDPTPLFASPQTQKLQSTETNQQVEFSETLDYPAGTFFTEQYGSYKASKSKADLFELSAFPEVQAALASHPHVNAILSKSGLESQIPTHLNRIGILNRLSRILTKTSLELDSLSREIALDAMQASIAGVIKELESIGLSVESRNVTNADVQRSLVCRTLLVEDKWSNKKFLITIAGLRFAFIGKTLSHEYTTLASRANEDIDEAFTIILKEDEEVTGSLIPFVFRNKELTDFDVLAKQSQNIESRILFKETLRFVNDGKLYIESVEVLFGREFVILVADPSEIGCSPLKSLIAKKYHELVETGDNGDFSPKGIVGYRGTLYRSDIRQELAIQNIANAFTKITMG